MFIDSVKPAVFDLFLALCIAGYLAIAYFAAQVRTKIPSNYFDFLNSTWLNIKQFSVITFVLFQVLLKLNNNRAENLQLFIWIQLLSPFFSLWLEGGISIWSFFEDLSLNFQGWEWSAFQLNSTFVTNFQLLLPRAQHKCVLNTKETISNLQWYGKRTPA